MKTMPITAMAAMVTSQAISIGSSCCTAPVKPMNAPSIRSCPWAKFTICTELKISSSPSATNAD